MRKVIVLIIVFVANISYTQNIFPLTGSVGIGTNNPSSELDVKGLVKIQSSNSNYNENLRLLPSLLGDYSSLALGAVAGNIGTGIGQWTLIRYPAANNYMFSLRYNATDFFNVLANGNVGIATASPTQKLDVNGNGIFKGSIISSISSDTGGNIQLINPTKNSNGIASTWMIYNMTGGYGNSLQFWAYDNLSCGGGMCNNRFTIMDNGNVGIGTSNPTSKLTVAGNIASREVQVTVNAGADFVFENDYNLPSLESVDNFIKKNKHLPEIASAKEMQKDGINLSEMNIKLLQKIEELTLYVIEQNKRLDKVEKENADLKNQIDSSKK